MSKTQTAQAQGKRGSYLNSELARAIPATDGTRRGYMGRKPRTTVKATDCKVYNAQGDLVRVIAARTSSGKAPQKRAQRTIVVKEVPMTYAERVRRFGTITEGAY